MITTPLFSIPLPYTTLFRSLRCATASSKYMLRGFKAPERQLADRLTLCRVDKARIFRQQRRAKHRPTLVFPHIAARGIWADLVLDRSRIEIGRASCRERA